MDILPEYAVIGGLDLHALPPLIFSDREHIRQLQLNDPVTGELVRMLEEQDQSDTGELVRTHPRSDALASFTSKLAPLYTGPYRVTQKLSDVNNRLTDVSTGGDAGVFHVVNLQPFCTWDSCNGPQHVTSESCLKGAPGDCSLHDEVPGDKDENFSVTEFAEPFPSQSLLSLNPGGTADSQ
ncbi:hypothetical protein DPX16_14002 [Anabarilius grahami]|uniref:Uncharacterized protein n=1 Tax=Anabarilius grahami TaxID=495550 RepID=A0A3N0Y8P4_ANAGA|nr:hypothetical protein DPX16_14002 [Anabarilius grahami]